MDDWLDTEFLDVCPTCGGCMSVHNYYCCIHCWELGATAKEAENIKRDIC